MVAMATGTLVADSGLSCYSFLVGLGLVHAHGPKAVLGALPSGICRQPLLSEMPVVVVMVGNGRSEVVEENGRRWSA